LIEAVTEHHRQQVKDDLAKVRIVASL
jgi:hypothetical protein